MQMIRQALYPISAALNLAKIVGFAVVNRVALEFFVVFHSIRQTDMSTEIENLTNAIAALEKGKDASPYLGPFLKELTHGSSLIGTAPANKKKLLAALKAHRLTFTLLSRGVTANTKLCGGINAFIPHDSPHRVK